MACRFDNYNLRELRMLAFKDKRMSNFTAKELNYFLRVRLIYDWFSHGMIDEAEGNRLIADAIFYYAE